jgi:hypothetical protein
MMLMMSLFPPWRGTVREALPENVTPRTFYVQHEVTIGYSFVFAPPTGSAPGVQVIPNSQQINTPLLLAQWAIVAALAALVASFLRDRAGTSPGGGEQG